MNLPVTDIHPTLMSFHFDKIQVFFELSVCQSEMGVCQSTSLVSNKVIRQFTIDLYIVDSLKRISIETT